MTDNQNKTNLTEENENKTNITNEKANITNTTNENENKTNITDEKENKTNLTDEKANLTKIKDENENKTNITEEHEKTKNMTDEKEINKNVTLENENKANVTDNKINATEDNENKKNLTENNENRTNLTENNQNRTNVSKNKINATEDNENKTNLTESNENKTNVTENKINSTEDNVNNTNIKNNEVKANATNENENKTNTTNENKEENKESEETEKGKEEKIKKDAKDLKVCVCTPVKKDNRYIREFVQFYEKWGVDKMIIYDNNEENDETFDEVIGDYMEKKFVKVRNWRGKHKVLLEMMNDCYERYNKKYDWILYYETDEFLHLKNYTNVKDFLNEKRFDKCNKIYLNWVFHTDNDLYHYENKSVIERFPIIEPKPEGERGLKHTFFKTMIRGNLPNVTITCVHRLNKEMKGCNGYGQEPEVKMFRMVDQDYENYYIDHYFSRSVDEFIDKLNKGDSIRGHDIPFKIGTFGNYFGFNNMTIEKVEYVENKTGLDLSKYKNILKERNKNIRNKY